MSCFDVGNFILPLLLPWGLCYSKQYKGARGTQTQLVSGLDGRKAKKKKKKKESVWLPLTTSLQNIFGGFSPSLFLPSSPSSPFLQSRAVPEGRMVTE